MIIRILKWLLTALGLCSALVVAGGAYVYFHPDSFPEPVPSRVQAVVNQGIEHYKKTRKQAGMAQERRKMIASEDQVALILNNGGIVQGRLISETEAQVTVRWEYGDAVFQRDEIAEIRKGREGDSLSQDVLVPSFSKTQR